MLGCWRLLYAKHQSRNDSIHTIHRARYLRKRLSTKYPDLKFSKPKNPKHSTKVYSSDFTHGELLRASVSSTSESASGSCSAASDSDTDQTIITIPVKAGGTEGPMISLQALYDTAMMVRCRVKTHPGLYIQWPPTAENFRLEDAERSVPSELYNLLAWCTGRQLRVSS